MEISYKLDNFEGPLDLLLHLIEKNKVSIYDIPIVLITEQYLEYVNQIRYICGSFSLCNKFLYMLPDCIQPFFMYVINIFLFQMKTASEL